MSTSPDLSIGDVERQLLEAIETNLNCAILARDADGIIHYANGRLLDWLGYEAEELIGQPALMLSVPDLYHVLADEMDQVERGDSRAWLAVLRRKNATTFPVLAIPQGHLPGDDSLFFSLMIDLGTVQTAHSAGYADTAQLRPRLGSIAHELQSIGLTLGLAGAAEVAVHHPDLQSLSAREREVLAHLVHGARVPTIAASLHIKANTVRNHLKSMYRQLGVGSQSELIEHVRALG